MLNEQEMNLESLSSIRSEADLRIGPDQTGSGFRSPDEKRGYMGYDSSSHSIPSFTSLNSLSL
jgi:hypothetical protein